MQKKSRSFGNFISATIAVAIFIILLLTGCGGTPGNHSFDMTKPCAAPCWHGLEPGKSTRDEVFSVLQQLSFIDQKSFRETNAESPNNKDANEITYDCIYQDKDECRNLHFYFDKGKLISISITPAYLLTFGDIVKQLGSPDYVYYSPHGPEDLSCKISIKWVRKSVFVESNYNTGQICPSEEKIKAGAKIRSDIKIIYLVYFQKDDEDSKPCDYCYPWPGFADQ